MVYIVFYGKSACLCGDRREEVVEIHDHMLMVFVLLMTGFSMNRIEVWVMGFMFFFCGEDTGHCVYGKG